MQFAAALNKTPQPATPSARPMAQSTSDPPASMAMTVVELEAAIAALSGKRDALREAFDRLAACSPSPLPFAWEDLDGHISSLQSSIALRFRQVRALETAGAAPAAAASWGTGGDGKGKNQELEEDEEEDEDVAVEVEEEAAVEVEEDVDEEIQEADSNKICNDENDGKEANEVEVEKEVAELEKADEDMQEANRDKFCNDEKDGKETREVEVEEKVAELEKKADEEMQEADYDKICNDEKDEKGAKEEVVEEEGVEEASNIKIGNEMKDEKEPREEEQAIKVNEQDPDKEMQVVDKDKLNTKGAFKASQDKEKDQDTNMDETVGKMASSVQHKEDDEACDRKQKEAQEQDLHEKVEGTKNATDQEAVIANEVSSDQGNRALPCRSDCCTVACANMDAKRLVKLICTNTDLKSELRAAFRCAPDAAAVALHVVESFLHNKTFVRTNKVWANCVELVQMVPVVVTKPSADTIEQAKRVAMDWKEMIDSPESCYVLGSLASWGLLYFLISYNIVTEFDMKEIFRLFGNIPFKQKKKSAMLLKGLGLSNRIPELMDYLIRNGQQMDVLCLARIFNMVDKYPPLSLLKGYVEKAKQTAMEISQKNMTRQLRVVIIKELDNLRRAHFLAKKEITNTNLCTSIREEINILLSELEKKKRGLANPLTASTSNSQQRQTKSNKKHKIRQKQEHHKGQEDQMEGQLSGLAEKLEKKQRKPQQEQQQKPEDGPEEKKQKPEDGPEEKKQKQEDKPEEKKRKQEGKSEEKQKHHKRLSQRTPKPPPQGYPAMWNAAMRSDLEPPPYAAMHAVHLGYPVQPGRPGVHCASPFIGPFTPWYPGPQFYPR